LMGNAISDAIVADSRQRKEDLETNEATRPLQRGEIEVIALGRLLGHIAGAHPKTLSQHAAMPAEEHPGAHGDRQRLVRVPAHGVRPLNALENMTELRSKAGTSAPRGINVKPGTMRRRDA